VPRCLFSIVFVIAVLTFPTQIDTAVAADDADTTEVRIVNLYDAFGKGDSEAKFDFGFSAFVEYRGTKILFDAGTDADILRRNAQALGIDLKEVDYAVASHSHADHISGFDYLLEVNPDVRIYFPKDFFGGAAPIRLGIQGTDPDAATEIPEEMRYFGGGVDIAELRSSGRFWKANVDYLDSTAVVAPGVTLVSTRSPFLGTFSRYPNLGITGEPSSSDVNYIGLPELSMMLETERGAVLIVGCSHSTIEAIVQESVNVSGDDIALVMGGYHLLPYTEEELTGLAKRLKNDLGVAQIAPAHCTGHLAFKVLMSAFGDDFIRAGLGSEIRF
jgi:7,8-dihydropterin-6-yl-methyl-4-(beta-D-ribofuranosyl)aminobenzene 5'-phosphate synthase